MFRTRVNMEQAEHNSLAPYAQLSGNSAGRMYQERAHPYRTDYQRDRARVVHSRAFRRLEYKTQVFLNGTGDHLRTRLTHTIEVASISRTIACALGANEDLAEVIALAHDLGHAPFGHTGEEKLNEIMRGHGGFEHNLQSLRVVELLEVKYPRFPGLNLSYEVLEGLRKHDRGYSRPAFADTQEETFANPSLEAQIANVADEITYYSHDLDDGLDHHLITVEQLNEIEIWNVCYDFVRKHFPDLKGNELIAYVIRTLIDYQVEQLVAATHERLETENFDAADAVRRHPRMIVAYSDRVRRMNQQLRKFLYQNLYYHPDVNGPNRHGGELIESVFSAYLENPEMLGNAATRRLEDEGLHRTVCDYIAGMTDRFIMDEAVRLGLPLCR
ncbi:MAG: deoxyguanosinetriphosphate triphosphohydrolase [Verrucomicrobia bacterium]|nr:deoxyguanosinetriphosphate triphosphohydrolase [Verrucomicrobiota bacterium]